MATIFPSGIAEKEAFCNRENNRKLLAGNIKSLDHTVVLAPRRYGKTSLINKVLSEQKIRFAWVDLLSAASQDDVQAKIIKAIGPLIFELAPNLKKLQIQLQSFFKSMNPEISLGGFGQKVVLKPGSTDHASIEDILLSLDRYVANLNKQAVIVFDEFQQLSELKEGSSIEAMIRHAVERSRAITYIFSGSNRHILAAMFSDSQRPLYRLCEVMPVDRIAATDYKSFLNQAAKVQWKEALAQDVFEKIMACSARHPFYVNALCNKLWKAEQKPSVQDVIDAWEWYVNTHKSIIVSSIIDLSPNQKKVLTTLAAKPTTEVFGKDFIMETKLSASSIKQAVDVLVNKDIIYQNEQGEYHVLDPAVQHYLLNS